jgi:hypothetical protein
MTYQKKGACHVTLLMPKSMIFNGESSACYQSSRHYCHLHTISIYGTKYVSEEQEIVRFEITMSNLLTNNRLQLCYKNNGKT